MSGAKSVDLKDMSTADCQRWAELGLCICNAAKAQQLPEQDIDWLKAAQEGLAKYRQEKLN